MGLEEIEIVIDENGDVSFDVRGVKGKGCADLTKKLDDALGKVTRRKHQADYFHREHNRLRQGH